ASLPVQEYLSMPFDCMHKQYEIARHLPAPLYVLFVQASAYSQACDKKLLVTIEGNVEEAKALFKPPDDSQDDESDSDAEEEQTTKRRRPTLGVQLDDKRKEMLKKHPLSVYIVLNDLLNPDSVLGCLYTGDNGKKTPNPANRYQFDKVGIQDLSDYISELGHPYLWVQAMGGLHFPTDHPQPAVVADNALSASHMEKTIHLLRSRLQSRLSLHKQFASLGMYTF
ncbi:hypothetical protein AB205_0007790, partial [Aquarana catesbeiana]